MMQTCYRHPVEAMHQRIHGAGSGEAPWLITLGVQICHGFKGAYPQARAVIDDFGNLVIVRGWQ